MGKKSRSGSGIRDEQPGSYFLELRNHFFGLKYLNSLMRIRDPGWKQFGPGIRDPGWKKVDPGSGLRDKHPGSATLVVDNYDPTFHFDTDTDPDSTPCFTHVKKSEQFFLLPFTTVPVYIALSFSSSS